MRQPAEQEPGDLSSSRAGPTSLSLKIRTRMSLPPQKAISFSSLDVVHWTLCNTIDGIAPAGVLEWSTQGVHFSHTHNQEEGLGLR